MNTDNIYIAKLGLSKKISFEGTLADYYFGEGIRQNVRYKTVKYILIKRKETSSLNLIGKDLNTNKKYICELPLEEGKLFIPPDTMIPFEILYPDAKRNLSKKKILKMGNSKINEIIKKIGGVRYEENV